MVFIFVPFTHIRWIMSSVPVKNFNSIAYLSLFHTFFNAS